MLRKIIVASENPVKIAATQRAFEEIMPDLTFAATGIAVASGVSDQPVGDAETLSGARNRVAAARRHQPEADYWVGIEGGIMDDGEAMAAFAWIVIRSNTRIGESRSGMFYLPPRVADRVRNGLELGHANDAVFGIHNSKRSIGAIGLLTREVLDRQALYHHAVLLALPAFVNPDLYDSIH